MESLREFLAGLCILIGLILFFDGPGYVPKILEVIVGAGTIGYGIKLWADN